MCSRALRLSTASRGGRWGDRIRSYASTSASSVANELSVREGSEEEYGTDLLAFLAASLFSLKAAYFLFLLATSSPDAFAFAS